MNQITKRDLYKKKPRKEIGHLEGKYWCNCKTRNYRRWLAIKKWGPHDGKYSKPGSLSQDD